MWITRYMNEKLFSNLNQQHCFQENLLNVNTSEVDYLLGIFNSGHLNYNLEANDREPDLTDMSLVAMNILNRNKNGYLLMIEGM